MGKYCSAPSPYLNVGRRPQSCTVAFANHHSFILRQGTSIPPGTGSGLWSCWGNQRDNPRPPAPAVPASHQVRKKRKSLIPARQRYCTGQHLCELLPSVFSLSHVGCIDSERFGSKLTSSVTSGWGLCRRRCCEGICFPQIMFSHLVPSLEALDSSALDYLSHIVPHPIALSTLLPVLQPFLSPPTLGHPAAASPPLQPSPLPCLHSSLSAPFASNHGT